MLRLRLRPACRFGSRDRCGFGSLYVFCQIHHCNHCGHDNEDLSEDDDGDLVCEECGHVIEVRWLAFMLRFGAVSAARQTPLTWFDLALLSLSRLVAAPRKGGRASFMCSLRP